MASCFYLKGRGAFGEREVEEGVLLVRREGGVLLVRRGRSAFGEEREECFW